MTKQAIISIKGSVQGIFFRSEAREKARAFGLAGWVKNEADGSVTACAQGPSDPLEQFIRWCRQGPPGAKVEKINVNYTDNPAEKLTGFEIKYF